MREAPRPDELMALTRGTRIGPYEVTGILGAGGMGEVYRATDVNLSRQVAIKVLPETFANDPERLARFEREAKTLASLNHPNIAQIYGFEKADGIRALVIELVEGPTLADRIAQGPIPVDEALPVAKQIAEALEAAHEQGIIHRDLKPANIKLRPDGTVKVLDFGLAKALEPTGMSPNVSQSPTITSPAMMTGVGVLLGTAAYMSPEQARGKAVDKRSDIWAFGCVLYEMLTGRRAFEGEDVAITLSRVLQRDPDFVALSVHVPRTVRQTIRLCLQKDPRDRVRDAGDVRLALAGAFEPVADDPGPPSRGGRRSLLTVVVSALAAGIAAVSVWAMMRGDAGVVARLTIVPREATPAVSGTSSDIAISPDGKRLAYITGGGPRSRLYLRPLDQLDSIALVPQSDADGPFFSPDGNWVGFVEALRALKKVAPTGGPAVDVHTDTAQVRGASWGPDDSIVFGTDDISTGLKRVSATGGAPEVLTKPAAGTDHYFPAFLANGRGIIFTIVKLSEEADAGRIAVFDLESGTHRILVEGGGQARYVPSGHIVYSIAGSLRAVPFDLDTLSVLGNPVPIVDRVITKGNGAANYSVSQTGTLVYQEGNAVPVASRKLVWVDRQGHEEAVPAPPRAYASVFLSPDGTRVALGIADQANDIWAWTIARQTLTRLTFSPASDVGGIWSPDGRRIAFSRLGEGGNVFWQLADGTGNAERLTNRPLPQRPHSISPDGTRLIFSEPVLAPRDLGVVMLGGDRKSELLMHTPFDEVNGEVSPDGRWLAYQSNESGNVEIYVRPFPEVNGGKWQISTSGGSRPSWAASGRELFYFQAPGRIFAVPVKSGSTFAFDSPTLVVDNLQYVSPLDLRVYAASPDGQRFLMIRNDGPDPGASQLIVVQNWFEELQRLVPGN